jgi:hypothetical protein
MTRLSKQWSVSYHRSSMRLSPTHWIQKLGIRRHRQENAKEVYHRNLAARSTRHRAPFLYRLLNFFGHERVGVLAGELFPFAVKLGVSESRAHA